MHLSYFRPLTEFTTRKEIMRNKKRLITMAMAAVALQFLASCFTYKKEETTSPSPTVVTEPPTTTSETTSTTTTDNGTTRRSTTTSY
jgi:uncharacterized lipoprotein YajG